MGNTVSYDRRSDVEPLEMNSGLTSVFVSTLALAASRLAQSEHQKELAAWFGSRDQNVFGVGIVGFDVGDIPWCSHSYPEDRAFVLQVIAAAKARTGWEALGYEPRVDWLTASLDHFAQLIEAFSEEDIAGSEKRSWPWGKPDQWTLCGKHMVFQHIAGCVVCNDQPA
jgi:hypothetical protein